MAAVPDDPVLIVRTLIVGLADAEPIEEPQSGGADFVCRPTRIVQSPPAIEACV